MITNRHTQLSLLALTSLVISAIIGGGIFNLPSDMAAAAGIFGIISAWIITGIGMFALTETFRRLSQQNISASSGIFTYAELGFGRFAGFLMAWGYWISAICATATYAILIMQTIDNFIPGYFSGGNSPLALAANTGLIWIIYFLMRLGAREVGILNSIGTITKMLPILAFLLVIVYFATFNFNTETIKTSEIKSQNLFLEIKHCMFITLWVFIGIEGAIVTGAHAKNPSDIGRATQFGFFISLIVYVLISLLPFFIFSREHLANASSPSLSYLIGNMLGDWSTIVMNIGLLISVLSAWIAWMLIIIQTPFSAAKDNLFPKIFLNQNSREVPVNSLLISTLGIQIALFLASFAQDAWLAMLKITGVTILPPYLFSALFLLKSKTRGNILIAATAAIYSIWLLYAAGLFYLLLGSFIFALGIPVYRKANKEFGREEIPSIYEKFSQFILVILAIIALFYFASNNFKL